MKYNELITSNNMVTAATGATAIYLVSKALLAILRSPPFSPDSMNLASLSTDSLYSASVKVSVPGELTRLLMSLNPNLDDGTKRRILRDIAQCIYLKESEASGCTNDDIKLLVSFLDDRDEETKTETLNALKAFSTIWNFQIKIQEYIPKIIETVTSNWDNNLQIAGLKLLNALHIPDHTHTLLRRQLTNFMAILLTANTPTKIQVLRFLGTLMEKEDLLYDIMNCQAPADFLNLFQSSQPENLLYEMLVFLERLSEGRQTPQYQSMQWDYSKNSLHEIIFGDNSRLSERLLALIVHLEEDVQTQACKVILSLKINKEESRISNGHSLASEISAYPLESTRKSMITNASLINQTSVPATESSIETSGGSFHPPPDTNETSGSFYPLSGANGTNGSFHPLSGANETKGSFQPLSGANETSGSFFPLSGANGTNGSFHPLSGANETKGSFQPLSGANETQGSFYPLSGANETSGSFHPLSGANETSGSFQPLSGANETSGSFYPLSGANETNGSFHPLSGANETNGSFQPLSGANGTSGSFYPLSGANETNGSFYPLSGANETNGSFQPLSGANETSGSFYPLSGANETNGSFHPLSGTNETSGSFHPLLGTNETGHSFYPLERADHSFQPLPNISMEGSERVVQEPMDSFHTPPIENDDSI